MSHLTTNEIFDWICIVMIIFGTTGNILGLIVFSSRKFRQTTYGRLAIASFIINLLCVYRYSLLLHSSTRRWIAIKAGQSWFNCKLYRLSASLRIISAFVTVAWTYERYIYVSSTNVRSSTKCACIRKCKFYLMTLLSIIIVTALNGPAVYFYELGPILLPIPQQFNPQNSTEILNAQLTNTSSLEQYSHQDDETSRKRALNNFYGMTCGLKESISSSWRSFLIDVSFGFNYTTFRSIFSEIIPSLFVIYFNIGIIICVVNSTLSFSKTRMALKKRQNRNGSIQEKEDDGLMVHNRPRTSWMNIVLIIHSCLFFFSSLTSTFVHWFTSDVLLSYWTSVVILANSSLNFYVYCLSGKSFRNEIRKLMSDYFEFCCILKFMNLFRTKSQREQVRQSIRMRSLKYRGTTTARSTNAHIRTPSFT